MTTIRIAGTADAEALSRLGAATFRETFGHLYPSEDLAAFLDEFHSAPAWSRLLSTPTERTWIAEHDHGPVGYALAGRCKLPHPDVTPRSGELKRLYVARDQKGLGLGRLLLDEALSWLASGGHDSLWIGVYSENHHALQLYQRRGFTQVGEYLFPVGATRDRELILRRSSP